MSEINPIIVHQFTPTSALRAIESQQNTKVNGILFDITFIPDTAYMSEDKFKVYKNLFVDLVLRRGGVGAGQNHLLIDSVSLYQLLQYSDYKAGVSVKATASDEMIANTPFRISGYVDLGYFALDVTDSLDIELYCSESPSVNVDVKVSTVYTKEQLSFLKKYAWSLPTGSDQSFNNVLSVYIDTASTLNKTISIRDEVGGNSTVSPEDSIALSNAIGNFEVFTRFGEVYTDPFGIGQNITLKVPTDNDDLEILVVGLIYDVSLLGISADTWSANRDLLLTKVVNQGGEKLDYLRAMGII